MNEKSDLMKTIEISHKKVKNGLYDTPRKEELSKQKESIRVIEVPLNKIFFWEI